MKQRFRLWLVSTIVILAVSGTKAQREGIDKIIAVVGDEVVLASELAGQLQLMVLQSGKQPGSQSELDSLQMGLLEGMISDRLFLIEARKDTSIVVTPDEIDQALDDHMARIMQNFGSEEAFMQALAAEDLSVRDLRRRYRSDVENQLLKQRLMQQKLYSVQVSRHEVEQFYEEFQDSIPAQPEAVKLGHILIPVSASPQVEDSVRELTGQLRQRAIDGESFADLSSQYSSFGAGANGGDLGFVSRDDVVPEFSRAAFNLDIGDISGVIKTQFGFHVIKCEGRREHQLKLRHILLGAKPTPEDTARSYRLADSLIVEMTGGADFAELAKVYSIDDESRIQGGELGWFAAQELPPEFAEEITGWTTPGEYRGPVLSQFGLHVLKLLDHSEEKQFSLESDFDRIKELARSFKTEQTLERWVEQIKDRTFIDYRLDD